MKYENFRTSMIYLFGEKYAVKEEVLKEMYIIYVDDYKSPNTLNYLQVRDIRQKACNNLNIENNLH